MRNNWFAYVLPQHPGMTSKEVYDRGSRCKAADMKQWVWQLHLIKYFE